MKSQSLNNIYSCSLCHCTSNGIYVMPLWRHPDFQKMEIIQFLYCIISILLCGVWSMWVNPSQMMTLFCLGDFANAPNTIACFILRIKKQFSNWNTKMDGNANAEEKGFYSFQNWSDSNTRKTNKKYTSTCNYLFSKENEVVNTHD